MKLYGDMDAAYAGLIFGVTPKDIVSRPTWDAVEYGQPVFAVGDGSVTASAANNKATVTLGTVAANDAIALNIKGFDGEDFAVELTAPSAVSAEVTAAVVEAVNASPAARANKVFASSSAAGTVVLTGENAYDLTVSGSVGSNNVTVAYASTLFFAGVVVAHQRSYKDYRAGYKLTDTVNVLEKGKLYAQVADGVSPRDGEAAYVKDGKFTNVSTGATDVGAYFRGSLVSTPYGDAVALVEVNGIKA